MARIPTPVPELARLLLVKTTRWPHTSAVGTLGIQWLRQGRIPRVVAQAAWLIDIGHAPELATTGVPAADGARFLARRRFSPFVVSLVGHHIGAMLEGHELQPPADIAPPPRDLADALTALDLSIDSDGFEVDPCARIEAILKVFPTYHPTHRTITAAKAGLLAACARARAAEDGDG